MYDIIIIGAGPAGMTAGIYARRAKKKVLILEKASYGGQIITADDIENFPTYTHISGFDFATNLYNQVKELGAEILFEKVIDIKNYDDHKEVITTNNTYNSQTIIVATGADNRKLGLDNEDALTGKGISYCATCDGAFYKDKIVAVNGGGNTAIEDALYLSNLVKKIYLIHRRDTFRADEILLNKLKEKSNIEFILNSKITKINGTQKLESIDISNDKETTNLKIDGLFIAIGRNPENQNFANIIDLDEKGYVKALENCHTNVQGIYAAGDNRIKDLRQLVTATSDGAVAATEAIKYINEMRSKNV